MNLPLRIFPGLLAVLAAVAPDSLSADFAPAPEKIRVAVVGMPAGARAALVGAGAESGVEVCGLSPSDFQAEKIPDLADFDAALFSFAPPEARDGCFRALAAARERNPELLAFTVGPPPICAQWREGEGEEAIRQDPELAGYYGISRESMRRMLLYLLAEYFGRGERPPPPATAAALKVWHPEYGELAGLPEFLDRVRAEGRGRELLPRAAVVAWRHHCLFHQPRVIEALIRELERRDILAVCLAGDDPGFPDRLRELGPDLVVLTSHTNLPDRFWEDLDVPRIHTLWFMEESISRWAESVQTGMSASSLRHQIVAAEARGATECLTAGGTLSGMNSGEEILPIPDRIERIGQRARAWINLGTKENRQKKIALITYDREVDKAGLMSGPQHCLNGPRSMIRFLTALEESGYGIEDPPADEGELLERLIDHGRQMGTWEKGNLDRLARSGKAVLVPDETYLRWFEQKVPPRRREEMIASWGRPPGEIMVWEDSGRCYLVLPRLDLGRIVLLAQPPKGETITATASRPEELNLFPPTHHFLATYFWLQEEFGADAVVHFGSHGQEWLFPGKAAVLSRWDWSDILLGGMPNINPWLSSNIAEVLPCKRRARAVTLDYLPPPLINADLTDELLNLQSTIEKWRTLGPGALKEKFAEDIGAGVRRARLERELGREALPEGPPGEARIEEVARYLHDLREEFIPAGQHTLGEPPADDLLIPYLKQCLPRNFAPALETVFPNLSAGDGKAESVARTDEIIAAMVRDNLGPSAALRAAGGVVGEEEGLPSPVAEGLGLVAGMRDGFRRAGREIESILAALDGRFIPAGPSGAPERNPAVLPTGRNMFVLNPEELPSRSSWELGKRLIDDYLREELAARGRYPKKIAFSLIPYAAYGDYGIIESQILYLIGVQPIWDDKNRVREIELIPAAELDRPRIDVFLSVRSIYREELPRLVRLLDRAVRLAAAAETGENYLRENSRETERRLAQSGFPPEKARILSRARIFGAEPREVIDSHNWFFYLAERSGEWESRQDLLEVYLRHCRHVYTEDVWGEEAPEAFTAALSGSEAILRSWYDQRDFLLANKFAWWVDGMLSLAIGKLNGVEPSLLLVDVRDRDRAALVESDRALRKDFRARLINPKWIGEMMEEGYAGGNAIAKNIDNLLGWSITREQAVADGDWEELVEIYFRDREGLGLREWWAAANPHAEQKVAVTMLEAARKGFWTADPGTVRELADRYRRSIARHGPLEGTRAGDNQPLREYLAALPAGPESPDLGEERGETDGPGPVSSAVVREKVTGRKFQRFEPAGNEPAPPSRRPLFLAVTAAILIISLGYRRGPGIGYRR